MPPLASERSWLLNPDRLRLVHQCRRLIHSEFGVKLRLTEDHLEQQLANYAEKTRSSHLTKIWEVLKPQIPSLKLPEDKGGTKMASKRIYRGQKIDDEPPKPAQNKKEAGESSPQKQKMIYRGQVVG
jgi:hypothetical protein